MEQPVRVAYFCSTRELAGDEGVGTRRKGTLEHLVELLQNQANPQFARTFEIALIVIDDNAPQLDLDRFGIPVHVEPSRVFRRLPRGEMEARQAAKAEFETRIADVLDRENIDLVISDSWMTIFGPVMLGRYGGRMLNVHPADTNQFPGDTPTMANVLHAANDGMKCVPAITVHEIDPGIDTGAAVVRRKGEPLDMASELQGFFPGVERQELANRIREGIAALWPNPKVQKSNGENVSEEALNTTRTAIEILRDASYRMKERYVPEAMLEFAGRREVMERIRDARAERHNRLNPLARANEEVVPVTSFGNQRRDAAVRQPLAQRMRN